MRTLAQGLGMAVALAIGIGLVGGAVLLAVFVVRWLGALAEMMRRPGSPAGAAIQRLTASLAQPPPHD